MRRWWRPPAKRALKKSRTISMAPGSSHDAATERQHIGVVVLACQPRRHGVARHRGADTGNLVCGNDHADARAAGQDVELVLTRSNLLAHRTRIHRIVHGLSRPRADVIHLVTRLREELLDRFLGVVTSTSDCIGFGRRFSMLAVC
jgi:hypothetical protein